MKHFPVVLLLILISITQGVSAPVYQGFWCSGQVVLKDQQVVKGEISYDLKYNAIQVRKDGVVRTYTAENVAHFNMFDQVKHRDRRFVAIDHQLDEGYQRRTFFEVLTEGNLTVLRKTRYIRKPRVTEDLRAPHIYLNAVCRHTYYAFNEGQFFKINDFKEQVLPLMDRYSDLVSDYIKRCKLRLHKIHEQMRVVHLYNQLCTQQASEGAVTEMLD